MTLLLRFLFRLLSFAGRVFGAFVMVLALQIQWDGKTFEQYLVQFGRKFVVIKFLNQVSADNGATLRAFAAKSPSKPLPSFLDHPALQKAREKFAVPPEMQPEFKRRIQELRERMRREEEAAGRKSAPPSDVPPAGS